MAVTTQLINDGPRNVVVNIVGDIAADVAAQDILDPAALASIQPGFPFQPKAQDLSVQRIEFAIEDGFNVQLLWDATADVIFANLAGRGCIDYKKHGGLKNNAGAGKTGKIQLTTQGVTATAGAFTIKLWCKKKTTLGA